MQPRPSVQRPRLAKRLRELFTVQGHDFTRVWFHGCAVPEGIWCAECGAVLDAAADALLTHEERESFTRTDMRRFIVFDLAFATLSPREYARFHFELAHLLERVVSRGQVVH